MPESIDEKAFQVAALRVEQRRGVQHVSENRHSGQQGADQRDPATRSMLELAGKARDEIVEHELPHDSRCLRTRKGTDDDVQSDGASV
jgi:hypothetical protein